MNDQMVITDLEKEMKKMEKSDGSIPKGSCGEDGSRT